MPFKYTADGIYISHYQASHKGTTVSKQKPNKMQRAYLKLTISKLFIIIKSQLMSAKYI